MNKLLYDYDDPYKLLAQYLVVFEKPADVVKLLTDDEYLQRRITKELREQDFSGPFLDCLIERLLSEKRKIELRRELDKLAAYLYSTMDKERFRSELKKSLAEFGLEDFIRLVEESGR